MTKGLQKGTGFLGGLVRGIYPLGHHGYGVFQSLVFVHSLHYPIHICSDFTLSSTEQKDLTHQSYLKK